MFKKFFKKLGVFNEGEQPDMLRMKFLRHIDCPANTSVLPGSIIIKSWRVINDGKVDWPENCVLIHKKGNLEGDAGIVPPLKVNEEADLSIKIDAPIEEGEYFSIWKLVSPEGNEFG